VKAVCFFVSKAFFSPSIVICVIAINYDHFGLRFIRVDKNKVQNVRQYDKTRSLLPNSQNGSSWAGMQDHFRLWATRPEQIFFCIFTHEKSCFVVVNWL